jgi:hypothetical protein
MDIRLKMLPEGLELKGLSSPDKSLELTLHCTPVTQVTNVAPQLAALKETITSLEEQLKSFDFASVSAESAEMAKSEYASLTKRLGEIEKRLDVLGINSDFTKRLEQQLGVLDISVEFTKRLTDVEQQLDVLGITSDFKKRVEQQLDVLDISSEFAKRLADLEQQLYLLGITSDFKERVEQQPDVLDISSEFAKRLADVEHQLHLLGITSYFKKRLEQQIDVIDVSSEFAKRLADLEQQVADWDASGDEDSDEDDEDDKKAWKNACIEANAKKQESVDHQLTFLKEKVFYLERENANTLLSLQNHTESFKESLLHVNMAVSQLQYVERQYQVIEKGRRDQEKREKAAKERDEAKVLETVYTPEDAMVLVLDE